MSHSVVFLKDKEPNLLLRHKDNLFASSFSIPVKACGEHIKHSPTLKPEVCDKFMKELKPENQYLLVSIFLKAYKDSDVVVFRRKGIYSFFFLDRFREIDFCMTGELRPKCRIPEIWSSSEASVRDPHVWVVGDFKGVIMPFSPPFEEENFDKFHKVIMSKHEFEGRMSKCPHLQDIEVKPRGQTWEIFDTEVILDEPIRSGTEKAKEVSHFLKEALPSGFDWDNVEVGKGKATIKEHFKM